LHEIKLDLIDANPFQPRTRFEEETLGELAQSVRELGIITPITVRHSDNGRYQIISGERRYKAAAMAHLTAIPAYVMDTDDRNVQIMALVENIQREDLNPIDIAAGFQDLIEKYDLTQEKISEMVGMKRAAITNYLRLLKLPPEIQNAVQAQTISMGHAKVLLGIDNAQEPPTLQDLIAIQTQGNYSCVILNGDKPRTFNQRGVADLYDLLHNEPALLKGATMVDKVVGKGAAALMIVGNIKRLHTRIICTPALEMLRKAGVEVTFDQEVEYIYNIPRTGWCPLEARCKDAKTAEECMPLIADFVKSMKANASHSMQ
jgi:ParB/RepB/Spo0J family partition protein